MRGVDASSEDLGSTIDIPPVFEVLAGRIYVRGSSASRSTPIARCHQPSTHQRRGIIYRIRVELSSAPRLAPLATLGAGSKCPIIKAVVRECGDRVPALDDPHVVCDNYAAHKHAAVRKWLARPGNQRITLHFTPTGCSWINLVPARPSAAAPSPPSRSSPPPSAPHRSLERPSPALRLDQGRRRDPRQHQPRED